METGNRSLWWFDELSSGLPWIFNAHVVLSARVCMHVHNIVQEVEVHGWLLSGIEEWTIIIRSFFYSCICS